MLQPERRSSASGSLSVESLSLSLARSLPVDLCLRSPLYVSGSVSSACVSSASYLSVSTSVCVSVSVSVSVPVPVSVPVCPRTPSDVPPPPHVTCSIAIGTCSDGPWWTLRGASDLRYRAPVNSAISLRERA
eukprot:1312207-Rhodomonas_salina.1